MIDRTVIEKFVEFGHKSNQNSKSIKFNITNFTIEIKSNISEDIDDLIISAFFTTKKLPDWEINVWRDSSNLSLDKILNVSQLNLLKMRTNINTNYYRFLCDPSGLAIYAIDLEYRRGSIWISEKISENIDFFLTPFRALISWIIGTYDGEVLHGACLELDSKIVALSGSSGSGKSVLAHKAIGEKLRIIGDDAFAVMPDGIFPIYTRTKLNYDIDPEYVGLKKESFKNYSSKQVYCLNEPNSYPGKNLDYLLFPKISVDSKFLKLDISEAIKRLILENCTETIGLSPMSLSRITKICRDSRAFSWQITKDVNQNFIDMKNFIIGNS